MSSLTKVEKRKICKCTKIEHLVQVIRRQFCFAKIQDSGIGKYATQLLLVFTLFDLSMTPSEFMSTLP